MAEAAKTGDQATTEKPAADDAAAKAAADAAAAAKTTSDDAAAKAASDAAAAAEAAKGGKGKEPAATGAPEKYSLTIPDDGKVHYDDADLKRIEKSAREAGLTNDEAQAYVAEQVEAAKAASAAFLAETTADPDYGGDKLIETQRLAKSAIDLIRPVGHARRESFTRFLNKVGAANHIEVLAFLADLGRRAGEDSTGQTTSASLRGQKTPEEVLYGATPKT